MDSIQQSPLFRRKTRRFLRVVVTCALILLTIFSGRATAGCICADGHFELFCGRGLSHTASTSITTVSCSKCGQAKATVQRSCCAAKEKETPNCHLSVGSASSRGCCHPLTLAPMVLQKATSVSFDVVAVDVVHATSPLWFSSADQSFFVVHDVDSSPPRSLLPLLQRFVI